MTPQTNPLDTVIRRYLMEHTENQGALAASIGRDRSWLNRYVNGSGVASIDDVILLLAAMIRAQSARPEPEALSALDLRLVRCFRSLPDDLTRADVLEVMEAICRARRQRAAASAPSDSVTVVVVPKPTRKPRRDVLTPSPEAEQTIEA